MSLQGMNTKPLGPNPLWGFTSLPLFYRGLARVIAKDRHGGKVTSEDIHSAIRKSRSWSAGQGRVSLKVRAAASRADAEFERKKREAAKRRAGKVGV